MTVGDKMRSWTDEKLADYLSKVTGGVIKDTDGKTYKGKDEILKWIKSSWIKCGKPGEPLTNEEYIRSCSTEELARWIQDLSMSCFVCGSQDSAKLTNIRCPYGKCIQKGTVTWLWKKRTTNEEFLRNCSTEELAETIAERIINTHTMFEYILHQDNRREEDLVREIREWLKEKHE